MLEEFVRRPGGGAANFAAACAKLGLKSGLVGCIGNDEFGKEILIELRRKGVNTAWIKVVDAPTGLVISLSTPGGDHFLVAHRGANSFLRPEDIDEDHIKGAKLLHASSVAPEIALAAGSKAKKQGILASLDLGAELAELRKRELLDVIERFDICFMNRRSYRKVFGERPSKKGIPKIFPRKLKLLVVTMGPNGAMATDCSVVVVRPSYEVKVKDTTGAGDAFAAAFDAVWLQAEI